MIFKRSMDSNSISIFAQRISSPLKVHNHGGTKKRYILKKFLVALTITLLLLSMVPVVPAMHNKTIDLHLLNHPSSTKTTLGTPDSVLRSENALSSFNLVKTPWKKVLMPGDEGPHFHRLLPLREWWYYNVIFDKPDSDLQGWSAMISFNYMSKSFHQPDILFVTLYDNENRTYGGMINRERGTLQATGPGVNLTFDYSWVKGVFPQWNLHIEDSDADSHHEIIFDLSFRAECSPYWVLMNTGHGNPRSPFGYYSINYCDVTGSVILDNISYKIHGTGYHDHTWALYMVGGASFFWDWFSVHFDNGLHAFIWQLIPLPNGKSRSSGQCFSWITDGTNFSDLNFFEMNYLDFEDTSINNFARPKLFHIKSTVVDIEVDLLVETKNMHEYLWDELPFFSIGLWEGSCVVTGTLTLPNGITEITGMGIAEIFRII